MSNAQTEMIEYTTACRMAEVYRRNTTRILEMLAEIGVLSGELKNIFRDRSEFDVEIVIRGGHYKAGDKAVALLARQFKTAAWACLVEHTGIRKFMSSARQQELNDCFWGRGDEIDKLPEISETTIMEVLSGYLSSAGEFLEETIRAEYDWWRPSDPGRCKLKTNANNAYAMSRKLICTYATTGSNHCGGMYLHHRTRPHVMSLDNIMHLLDGKGMVKGNNGPLVDAIDVAMQGSTDYFRFKCFKNGNLHLEFTRLDLLAEFNKICGRNRLPGA